MRSIIDLIKSLAMGAMILIAFLLQGSFHVVGLVRRVVVDLLFVAVVITVIALSLTASRGVKIEDGSWLELALSGDIVEEAELTRRGGALTRLALDRPPQTRLRDIVAALDKAASDRAIAGVLLRLDDLDDIGLAAIDTIGAALDRFKTSGKKVTIWSASYDQRQYAIAAHASEAFLHPLGEVSVTGLANYRLYWGQLLRDLGINVHVFKAGAYKSFPETYTRSAPSPEALAADRDWLNDAWAQLADDVQSARGLMPGALSHLIDEQLTLVREARGNMATLALGANLVDGVKTEDEVIAALVERQSGKKDGSDLRSVGLADYLSARGDGAPAGRHLAVIVLEGEIRDDSDPRGSDVGALIEEIRSARQDDEVAALVLRVNSPGGSAVGSEAIRRELELTRQAGKPVVVSMSDYAASGGYWVSLGADWIVADPLTITGSIGVFGLMPTFEGSLDKLRVGSGGVATSWLAMTRDPALAMDERFAEMMNLKIERVYQDFIALVSQARHLPLDAVAELAQGRVYTGRQAKEKGLVDELGGLDAAVAHARGMVTDGAGLPVVWRDKPARFYNLWLDWALSRVAAATDRLVPFSRTARRVSRVMDELEAAVRSRAPRLDCLCGSDR